MVRLCLFLLLLVLSHAQRENDHKLRHKNGGHHLAASMEEPQKLTKTLEVTADEPRSHLTCHSYNDSDCALDASGNCRGSETCQQPDISHPQLCYILWAKNLTTGQVQIRKGGCWVGSADGCHARDRCVERRKKPRRDLFFCCCSGHLCNGQADHDPAVDQQESAPDVQRSDISGVPTGGIVIVVTLMLFVFVAVAVLVTRLYRRKRPHFDEVPTKEEAIPISESNMTHGMGTIHSLESKAQGKFGSVFKASVGNDDRFVAVKVFTSRDYASWEQECKVYRLPQMKHENILTFLGSEKRVEPNQISYWLVTEYLEHGSLHDFLKARIVSFPHMLHIANGIACGLTHLHDQLSPRGNDGFKPTVAHRDFKSKNVLLKQDLTACIADFGLALVFDQNQGPIEALGQVGTRRYMAPEVLEGAISFYRDSLLRIDMYACGLVFWELISRCSDQDGPVPEYKQPFEAELGLNPTLEEMQESVCQQKQRPLIRETWNKHPGLRRLCDTIAEMWDQDAEARITSACVQERVSELCHQLIPNNAFHLPDADCPLAPDSAPLFRPPLSDHNNLLVTASPLMFNAYFNNRSTCASDSPLLTETST